MSAADREIGSLTNKVPEWPYPASWVDILIKQITKLPGPSWLFYLLILLLFSLLNNAVFWLDGTIKAGTFNLIRTTDAFYVVCGIGFYHYLKGTAAQALQTFSSAFDMEEAEEAEFRYRLTTLPAHWGWVALLIGIGLAGFTVQTMPAEYGILPETSIPAIVYWNVNAAFAYSGVFALVIQTIRQLQLVNFLHGQVKQIELFNLVPYHAFSRLTSRAGIILILIVLYNGILRLSKAEGVFIVLDIFFGLLACVTFVAPLMGMRSRLKIEQTRLQNKASQRLKSILDEVNQRVDSRELSGLGEFSTAINSLLKQQEILASISTWPWDPATVRGFSSTLLLPVFLWVITRILGRFF